MRCCFVCCFCGCRYVFSRSDPPTVTLSIIFLPTDEGTILTFHGLFNSNPGGALGLSVCPLNIPVSLRSRSITACRISASLSKAEVQCCNYFAKQHSSQHSLQHREVSSTHPIPLIHRMPSSLPSVLHRADGGHSGAGDAHELW